MLSELGRRPMIGANDGSFGDDLDEIGLLLREQRRQEADDREKELNLYRSGSAPPTVEGSLNAVGGLFGGGGNGGASFSDFIGGKNGNGFTSEKELRSDPAYLSYYYSNVNLNPRLPPPLLSKEDWRSAQRLKGGSSVLGGIGDRRKGSRDDNGNGRSMFSMPPGFESRKQDSEVESEKVSGSLEWGGDGLIGLPGLGLASKQKSLAEIFQDDLGRATPVTGPPSRPASRNAFNENVETLGSAEAELAHLRRELSSADTLRSGVLLLILNMLPGPLVHVLHPLDKGELAHPKREALLVRNLFIGVSSGIREPSELVAAFSGMNLATNGGVDEESHLPSQVEQDVDSHQNYLFGLQGGQNHLKQNTYIKNSESGHLHMSTVPQSANLSYSDLAKSNGGGSNLNSPSLMADRQVELPKLAFPSGNSYMKGSPPSAFGGGGGLPAQYHHLDGINSSLPNYGLSGYSMNPALASMIAQQLGTGNLPPLFENVAAASAMAIPGMDSRVLGGLGSGTNLTAALLESHNLGRGRSSIAGSALQAPYVDPMHLQYLRTPDYASTQLAAINDPSIDRNYLGGKSGSSTHHGYFGNPAFGVGMPYPGSPLASHVIPNSPVGPASPLRHNELNMRLSFWNEKLSWGHHGALAHGCKIAGHVVEFSADQYGSRFIQQKLETATIDEKNVVYEEIMPQALPLMTDVFGNYVIQKFFEHGLPSQRRELAGNLFGHVLTLSLQMYGCRVIQKAIEVVDLDQKIKMVEELDGQVMRCVRDQNGNHVIQKCIECIPEDNIQFIVSTFFDHVVNLSTHPYGCRVIQRILEHCKDAKTQSKVMDEILGAVSMLAQDQYGNYVVQHVLEHGKSHERSTIIKELAGKIVHMSQQKFASNVVEKCLTFSGPAERQILVSEMLGTTDENEPLQAMMKDQFANYVVQKVLETCDDQQRELILSRIKVHLNALKKYTYGKHIVARVEKLVAAGERRIAAQSLHPA
ncbi:hypothetical protein OIU78_019060 [Salix suchowensis]|nr:hypothetical protein OIU78_019060 [Salix suchowensis]